MYDKAQHSLCFGVCISKEKQCSNNSKKILPSKCLLVLLVVYSCRVSYPKVSYLNNLSTRTLHYGTVLSKGDLAAVPVVANTSLISFPGLVQEEQWSLCWV